MFCFMSNTQNIAHTDENYDFNNDWNKKSLGIKSFFADYKLHTQFKNAIKHVYNLFCQ